MSVVEPDRIAGTSQRTHVVIVRSLLTAYGGAEHTAVQLAVSLKRRGFEVTFVARQPIDRGHAYYRRLEAAQVQVLAAARWHENTVLRTLGAITRVAMLPPYWLLRRKPLWDSWTSVCSITDTTLYRLDERVYLRQFERLLAEYASLIIHIYGQECQTPLLAAWARTRGVSLVYTESGEGDEVYAKRFGLARTIASINQVSALICCGPQVAANIRRVYKYTGMIAEMPFLIEDPDERAVSRVRQTTAAVAFGVVGRLVEHKRHQDVLAAVRALREGGLPVELVIAGDGPMREALQEQARAGGISGAVTFIRHFDEIADVMARIDVFVLPSTSEAQPLAITEAMAFGRPVVASRFGGIPDQVNDGVSGFLVDPGDQEELTARLKTLAEDGELRGRMGCAAREAYLAFRRSDVVLDKIEAVYRSALAGITA